MAEISSLGYLVLGVSNLDSWEQFATSIMGFQVGIRTEHLLTLRMDQYNYRFMLEKDPSDDLIAVGWELSTEEQLENYVNRLRAKGLKVSEATEFLRSYRKVARLYTCADPNGYTHEFYVGPTQENGVNYFRSQHIRSGFKTGPYGLGHFVAIAKDVEESIVFYRDILGLKLSGYMIPSNAFKVAFFHTKNGRYHTLATGEVPIPKRIMHFAVEVNSLNDVGMAHDRAVEAGIPITSSIGHHPNAESVSFYMRTPSGFDAEILAGEMIVDDDNWQIKTYQEFSDWGHKPPKNLPDNS